MTPSIDPKTLSMKRIKILPISEIEARALIKDRLMSKVSTMDEGYSLATDRKFDIGISIFIGVSFIIILILSGICGIFTYQNGLEIEWVLLSVALVIVVLSMLLFIGAWVAGRIRRNNWERMKRMEKQV